MALPKDDKKTGFTIDFISKEDIEAAKQFMLFFGVLQAEIDAMSAQELNQAALDFRAAVGDVEAEHERFESIFGEGAAEGVSNEDITAALASYGQTQTDELERMRKVVEYIQGADYARWATDDTIRDEYANIIADPTGSVLATMSLEDLDAAILAKDVPPEDETEFSDQDRRLMDEFGWSEYDVLNTDPITRWEFLAARDAEAEGEDRVLGEKAQFIEDQFGEASTEGMTAGDIQELWMSLQTPAEAPTDPAGYGFEWQYDPGSNQYVKVPLGWEAQLAQQEFLSNPINFLQAAMFESGLDPDQQRYSGLFPDFLAGMTPGIETGTPTQDVLGKSFGVTTPSARGLAMLDPTQQAQLGAFLGSSLTPRSQQQFLGDVSKLTPPSPTGFLQR